MSKSTLSITVWSGRYQNEPRTFEVPCRLPDAFNFKFAGKTYTAMLKGEADSLSIEQVDFVGFTPQDEEFNEAGATAESILATIKAALGITGPVPPGSPLPAIALAYEAEVAAYEALTSAHLALPASVRRFGHVPTHPSDDGATGPSSYAARMLAKYIEHVVEQACKAQTERAESKSKEVK